MPRAGASLMTVRASTYIGVLMRAFQTLAPRDRIPRSEVKANNVALLVSMCVWAGIQCHSGAVTIKSRKPTEYTARLRKFAD